MKKKLLSLILSLITVICAVSPISYAVSAASYATTLKNKGFPDSYIDDLVALHSKYPNWTFEPLKTGLKWSTVISEERAVHHNQQVIQKSAVNNTNYYCSCEKCKKNGTYVIQLSPDWVCVSEAGLKYYMDPRNWLDVKHIFQFESTKYNSKHTQSGVESIISPTWMHDANITYIKTDGETRVTYKDTSGNSVKYSKAIMNAAKDSGMSAYYLASKIRQEVGSSSSSNAGGSMGTRAPFYGIYNYYNIGAYNNASNGLEWACGFMQTSTATTLYEKYSSTNNCGIGTETALKTKQYFSYRGSFGDYYKACLYTESGNKYTAGKIGFIKKSDCKVYSSYGRPWTNPYKTIYYGAQYIANGYNTYQYTGYLQKFNVNPASGSSLYSHEYTTTVGAPAEQSVMTYNAYNKAGVLDDARTFYIPVFDSMPSKRCTVPSGSSDTTTTTTTAPADAVTGLKLTGRTKDSLTFSWNKYTNATKYYVYVTNKTKGTTFDKTVTTNSATLKNLSAANEYTVKVRAYAKAWKSYSTSLTRHTLPPKATGLKQTKRGATTLTFTWNKVEGADGYNAYNYNASTKKYTKLASFTGTTGTVKNLKGGTTYKICIAAYVKDAETKVGAKSAQVSTYTKPVKVNLRSVSSPSNTKIKVVWDKPSGGVSGTQIVWAKDKAFKKKVAEKVLTGNKSTSYTGKNFTKGNTYYVRMRAYKTINGKKIYGAWSTVKSVKSK